MRFVATFLALASALNTLAAETKPTLSLMDAASQTMLAERIGKAYVWHGIEPGNHEAKAQLDQAGKQFERQLSALKAAAKANPDLKSSFKGDKERADELLENLSTLEQVWGSYQKLTAAPPTKEGGQTLAENAEEVVLFSQRSTDAIISKFSPESRPVALAENIATLSQRLARIYLLQSWGVKMPFLAKDLASARLQFDNLSKQLWALPNNTPSIKGQLDLIKSQWFFFQQAIDELGKNNADPQLQHNVITTSERIFQIATDLAVSYQHLAK